MGISVWQIWKKSQQGQEDGKYFHSTVHNDQRRYHKKENTGLTCVSETALHSE